MAYLRGSLLARAIINRAKQVLGIEQFGTVHDIESYHGVTRNIRLAYHGYPSYAPLCGKHFSFGATFPLPGQIGSLLHQASHAFSFKGFRGVWTAIRGTIDDHSRAAGARLRFSPPPASAHLMAA